MSQSETLPGEASYDYLPALDGLRAISILLVVVSHAGFTHMVPGILGVIIFFVISGFLITRQMIVEIESSGTLRLKAFYLRRIFRLAPALLLYIVLFTSILTLLGSVITPIHVLSGIFYLANYYDVFFGYPPHNPFPIVWSLSVEEHYYIVFPFIMLLFRRNLPAALPWLLAAMALALIWRFLLWQGCTADPLWRMCGQARSIEEHGLAFARTDTMFDCILYGAVAALALHIYTSLFNRLMINPIAFALALAGILACLIIRAPEFRETLRFSLESASVAIVIANILFGRWSFIRRGLSLTPMIFIGRLSYSLYLSHFGVMNVIGALGQHPEDQLSSSERLVYFVASFALAAASYYFVEQPMMAVRRRFGSHRGEAVSSKPNLLE